MHLRYVLVIPHAESEEDATPFQGWNPGILDKQFLHLIHILSCMPSDATEICMSLDELLAYRRDEPVKDVIAIGAESLHKIRLIRDGQLTVFLFMPMELRKIVETQLIWNGKAILLSPDECPGVIDCRKITSNFYRSIDILIFNLLGGKTAFARTLREPYSASVLLPIRHGVVQPSQVLLESFGFEVLGRDGVVLEDHELALHWVTETTKITMKVIYSDDRQRRELIVYAPAVKAFFYDFKSNVWNQILRKISEKWKRKLIEEMLFRNKSYSAATIHWDQERVLDLQSDPFFGAIMSYRQMEIYGTSAAIGLLSNVENVPSVRLPNSINLHQNELKNIETLSRRTDAKGMLQLQKKFLEFSNGLKIDIGDEIYELVTGGGDAIKLCSDVPFEWIYGPRLPLMISHEVSRLPMTPGNIVLQYAACGRPVALPAALLNEVLVVRSFKENDQIRNHLEVAIKGYPISDRMNVKIIDVQSEAAAVDALNGFFGAIVIFDCHGAHGGQASSGWLQIGEDRLNTWELAHRAKVPPIVLLSACSTSPVGGSHISVATGFLRSGALSVIGTFLPVSGTDSAVLVGRILYRIDQFLPAIKKQGFEAINWRTFIAGMLRMSFLTDVLYYFKDTEQLIDEAAWKEIHMEGNLAINSMYSGWYDLALERVSKKCGIDVDRLADKISKDHPLMETLYYSQIGMPEHIKIIL